ncbi:hypothetical protein J7U46_22945 [Pelomonas sp. V22]|uniref:hypothetical protein n=1 Tax=Pelomonas sp. V22 TaxID=2822139 RepID=UPI0024A80D36|nr:hypothetical protein [Pelomonas sp. V22]MDI4635929.1 hypothetical protein [Pelomonas sp. V22]
MHRGGQRGVVGLFGADIEPAARGGDDADLGGLLAAHESAAVDVALGVARAQPLKHLAVLEHLESPSAHRGSRAVQFGAGGLITPETTTAAPGPHWPEYAENELA